MILDQLGRCSKCAPAIGALVAGLASSYLGLRWPIVAGAAIVIAACIWVHRSRDQIENLIPEPGEGLAPRGR